MASLCKAMVTVLDFFFISISQSRGISVESWHPIPSQHVFERRPDEILVLSSPTVPARILATSLYPQIPLGSYD
ncbi:hypothetical protein AHAS_Ahas02G0155000 [Arachis hypogaea]